MGDRWRTVPGNQKVTEKKAFASSKAAFKYAAVLLDGKSFWMKGPTGILAQKISLCDLFTREFSAAMDDSELESKICQVANL